jgi:hypothetical protein
MLSGHLQTEAGIAAEGEDCYCDLRRTNPGVLEKQGVPLGYCGICSCGAPGHVRHYPGPVPVSGAWCDDCYSCLPATPLVTKLFYLFLSLIAGGLLLVWLL